MMLKLPMTGKRRRLLAKWLSMAVPNTTKLSDDKCFQSMTPEESKEVKEAIDDIFTFCNMPAQEVPHGQQHT